MRRSNLCTRYIYYVTLLGKTYFIRLIQYSWMNQIGGSITSIKSVNFFPKAPWWNHFFLSSVTNFHRRPENFLNCMFLLAINIYRPYPDLLSISPANGNFTVEHAINRAFTTLSNNGANAALYGDGQDHPGLGVTAEGKSNGSVCITDPNSEWFIPEPGI